MHQPLVVLFKNIILFDNLTAGEICISSSIRILALQENFLLQFQMDVSFILILIFYIWQMKTQSLTYIVVFF